MYSTELQHHGIKGQKWGVRRFQNEDGTLTPAGRSRYRADNYDSMTDTNKIKYHKDQFKQQISDYSKSIPKGKRFAKLCLFGSLGEAVYDSSRIMGDSRGKAAAKLVAASFLPIIGPMSLKSVNATKYAKSKVNAQID